MEARFIIDLIKDRKDKITNLNKQKVLKNGDDFKENKIRIKSYLLRATTFLIR